MKVAMCVSVSLLSRAVKRTNYRYEIYAKRYDVSGVSYYSYDPIIPNDPLRNEIIERLSSNDVFVDVGGHTGRYTLAAAAVGADVVTFEPNPIAFNRLKKNVKRNNFQNVTLLNKGLGRSARELKFYISSQEPRSSFNKKNAKYDDATIIGERKVEVTTIDECKEINNPDSIKIDAEGFEHEIICGGKKSINRNKPEIYLEPHDNNRYSAEELESLIEGMDYEIQKLEYPWICRPNN